MSEDLIDENLNPGPQETPQVVKTLAILSIIGSSLWGLLCFIAMIVVFVWADAFSRLLPIADPSGMVIALVLVFLILIGLNVLGLVGAIRMSKGKKSGFIMYAIGTGIWALLLLLSYSGETNGTLNLLSAVASIGFIVAFGMQQKNLS